MHKNVREPRFSASNLSIRKYSKLSCTSSCISFRRKNSISATITSSQASIKYDKMDPKVATIDCKIKEYQCMNEGLRLSFEHRQVLVRKMQDQIEIYNREFKSLLLEKKGFEKCQLLVDKHSKEAFRRMLQRQLRSYEQTCINLDKNFRRLIVKAKRLKKLRHQCEWEYVEIKSKIPDCYCEVSETMEETKITPKSEEPSFFRRLISRILAPFSLFRK